MHDTKEYCIAILCMFQANGLFQIYLPVEEKLALNIRSTGEFW